jgi:hypothetical protein
MNPFKPTPQKSRLEKILFQKYAKYILGNEPITQFVIDSYNIDLFYLKRAQK